MSAGLPAIVYDSIKITGSDYILGNQEKSIPDSFIVDFNKKIYVNYIFLKGGLCLPDIKYEIVNNGTRVRFYNIICSGLGSEYTFEISVRDTSGRVKIDSINYKCYNRKLAVGANIRNYFITNDNKYCWLITTNPNQLLYIDIEQASVIKTIVLPFTPAKVILNEQNNKLYLIRSADDHVYPNLIFQINPVSGVIEKSIPVLPDQYDHPSYQQVYAYDIGFTKSGYGVILIGVNGSSGLRWKIIDSQLNDSIYVHPDWIVANNGGGNTKFTSFQDVHTNYDKTKILMQELYGSTRLGELDYFTHALVEVVPPNAGTYYNNFISPNKINNTIYFGTVRAQFILSGSNILGYISPLDLGFSRSADFTYISGNELNIYFLRTYEFSILDYKNAKTLMSCRASYEFHDVNATTNGKYIIIAGTQHLYIFDTSIFYKYI